MPILCVEGADQSGKTTLCRKLVEEHGARYMHARVWKDMVRWHSGLMRRAVKLSDQGAIVVLDRHWVSDWVYGPIYRGKPGYADEHAQLFDSVIRGRGGYVLCVPSDMPGQLARHRSRAKSGGEMYEPDARLGEVVKRYADLAYGNVAHAGDTILDRYVRFGDFKPIAIYDIDSGDGADSFARFVVRQLTRRGR